MRPFQTFDFSYVDAVCSFCGLGGDWVGAKRKLRILCSFGIVDGALYDEVNVKPAVIRQTETRRDAGEIGMIDCCSNTFRNVGRLVSCLRPLGTGGSWERLLGAGGMLGVDGQRGYYSRDDKCEQW